MLTHKHIRAHTRQLRGGVRAANEVADIVALLWQRCAGVVCTQASE